MTVHGLGNVHDADPALALPETHSHNYLQLNAVNFLKCVLEVLVTCILVRAMSI